MHDLQGSMKCFRHRRSTAQNFLVELRRLGEGVLRVDGRQHLGSPIAAMVLSQEHGHRAVSQQLPVCQAQQPRSKVPARMTFCHDQIGLELRGTS